MTAEATLGRIEPLCRVVPVTRIADISPLDRSRRSVFCAVTPLAADLTTHLGKGLRPADAKASALMEAIERVSAEGPGEDPVRASAEDMAARGCRVADPSHHDLPRDTRWAKSVAVGWSPGRCLMSEADIWLPSDLVQSPPKDGVIHQVDTNGLASGNTRLEAVLHGLCEVIERDAVSQVLFAELYGDPGDAPPTRRIDPATLPASSGELLDGIEIGGRRVILDDLTLDVAVPVLRAMIVDPAYPGPLGPGLRVFAGYGCDPNAEVALNRALTEAAQSLLAVVQGARDSFNDQSVPRRAAAQDAARAALEPAPMVPFDTIPSFRTDDLREDLSHVLKALAASGHDTALVFDLTRADLGVPVVRARVPGMASFLVDRNRIGWRCLRWLT